MITENIRARFRASKEGRYELNQSFVYNGVRYSTDGRAALCEPVSGEPDTCGRFPSVSEIMSYDFTVGPWSTERLPAPKERPMLPCPYCAGGRGRRACDTCAGSGRVDDDAIAVIVPRETWVAVYFTWLLNQLPGLKWRTTGKNKPVLFTCDGGYGLVMPLEVVDDNNSLQSRENGIRFWSRLRGKFRQ